MLVQYERSMTICPFCLKEDAIVRLVPGRVKGIFEGFCEYHGQITGKWFWEDEPLTKRRIK